MDNGLANDGYRVNLDVFEGPLDLLLYLIKKNDLDVYDIPIAFLLEKYMRYLDTIRELNIDLAGDFLLMAAELAHIKSRMLLPEEGPAEEEEEVDPRADLVRRLLEYQRFKDASTRLARRAMLGRDVFVKPVPESLESKAESPIKGDVYDLVEAFSNLLKRVPAEDFHDVTLDRISVSERIYQILGLMKRDRVITLNDLLPDKLSRYDVVITFLSLLEMSRLKMIHIYQSEPLGSLFIKRSMEEVKEDEVMRLVEVDVGGAATESEEEKK